MTSTDLSYLILYTVLKHESLKKYRNIVLCIDWIQLIWLNNTILTALQRRLRWKDDRKRIPSTTIGTAHNSIFRKRIHLSIKFVVPTHDWVAYLYIAVYTHQWNDMTATENLMELIEAPAKTRESPVSNFHFPSRFVPLSSVRLWNNCVDKPSNFKWNRYKNLNTVDAQMFPKLKRISTIIKCIIQNQLF